MPTYSQLTPFARGEAVLITATTSIITDITGWTIVFSLKKRLQDTSTLLTASGTITGAAVGTYTITLTSAQTSALASGLYKFDVWRTDSGNETELAYGDLTVLPDVRYGA